MPPIPVLTTNVYAFLMPRLAANNTPIATLQYPTRTGGICAQLAAVEDELTAIKAAFVESLIISPSLGGARWGARLPNFQDH